MHTIRTITLAALLGALPACAGAEPEQTTAVEQLIAGGDITAIAAHAEAGGEVLPILEHYAAQTPPELSALARIYYARSKHVASFSEGQSEALLTIACLLKREAGRPTPHLKDAEEELDKKLNRFKASGTELVKHGEGWSYHDDKPFADDSWATSDFEDTFWSVGDAPFANATKPVATELKATRDIYLRRYFDVADPADVRTLRAQFLFSNTRVELYLNGTAAAPEKVGLPGSPLDLPPGLLKSGTNVLAAHLMPVRADSSHYFFDVALTANLPTAAHHLATITDSDLGTAIGKYWAALPEPLRKTLLGKGTKD